MKSNLFFSVGLIGKIGFTTAIPLVAFGLAGRYLDRHFNTSPWLFLSGLAIATIIVYFALKKIVHDSIKEFEKINK